jgi:hypothetical protein
MDEIKLCPYCGNTYETCESVCPYCGTPNI